MQLFCDGVEIELGNEIQNILVLNINYWGGGAFNIWGNNDIDQE